MFNVDIDNTVIVEQQKVLERALSTNPDTEKALRKLIRKVILEARAETVSKIDFQNGDPRQAAKSVRTSVYKKILGANINIYNSRKAHGKSFYEPPRTLKPEKPGGNRLPRSQRTQQVMSYGPLDRGFILRFVNSGTHTRKTAYGNRGSIDGKNFFRKDALPEMVKAVDNLANLIDDELENILNKKKN